MIALFLSVEQQNSCLLGVKTNIYIVGIKTAFLSEIGRLFLTQMILFSFDSYDLQFTTPLRLFFQHNIK